MVLYEDNHLLIANKRAGEIVQGDKTGDQPLVERLKQYIKETCAKPGQVFLGVVHRLDRPVSGVVVFARTSKALARMNALFATGQVHKTYWAIVKQRPPQDSGTLTHWLLRNEKMNKSFAYDRERAGAKQAILDYRLIGTSDRYFLLEVTLHTGRHHQIRCQLARVGSPIRGDLKYGYPRSNPDGSISLMARSVSFRHPVSGQQIHVEAPLPDDPLWRQFRMVAEPSPATPPADTAYQG